MSQSHPKEPEPVKSQEELIAEARDDASPTLNSPEGAAFRPPVIWRRYRRHRRANGDTISLWVHLPLTFWPAAACGLLTAGFLGASFLFVGSPIVSSVPSSLMIGGIVTWYVAARKMWQRVYGVLYISQNPDPLRPWQSAQFMRMHLPRLIFKGRQNEVFYGSYERGYMRVETSEVDLTQVTHQSAFYDMSPGIRQMAEGPLVDGHSRMRSIEGNGLAIHKARSKSITEKLAANWGFIVGVIFICITAYCLLQMQDGELLARPDVAEHREQVEIQRQQEQALFHEQLRRERVLSEEAEETDEGEQR